MAVTHPFPEIGLILESEPMLVRWKTTWPVARLPDQQHRNRWFNVSGHMIGLVACLLLIAMSIFGFSTIAWLLIRGLKNSQSISGVLVLAITLLVMLLMIALLLFSFTAPFRTQTGCIEQTDSGLVLTKKWWPLRSTTRRIAAPNRIEILSGAGECAGFWRSARITSGDDEYTAFWILSASSEAANPLCKQIAAVFREALDVEIKAEHPK